MSSRNAVAEFNYYLDTATSPEKTKGVGHYPIPKLCWMIDEGIIKPKDAIQAIHGKIIKENSEIVLLALELLNAVFYKCGSLVHKVICSEFYMSLLKEIIQTTDNRNIKETILCMLQGWAENFKYFPQYSGPQYLLQELKENEVPKITSKCKNKDTNEIHHTVFKQICDDPKALKNSEKFDKNRLKKTDLNLIKAESNECSSDNQTDAKFQEQEEFKKALREYKQRKKIDYNNYRKTLGLPPLSSDEEDNDDKKGARNCKSKQKEACMPLKSTSRSVPTTELQQVKDQRERLNSEIQQFRECKHNDYVQSSNGASKKIQQCKDKNCTNCEKYKRKDDTEEYRISKQLPYDIRKIVESKQRMNKNIEDIKKSKQEAYYNKRKSLSNFTNNDNKMEVDDYELKDSESEDEGFQRAIILSKIENVPKSTTVKPKQNNVVIKSAPPLGEIDETKYLEEVLAASKLDAEAAKINLAAAEEIQKNNTLKDTPTLGEIDETKYLEEVLAASKLDTGAGKIDSMTAEHIQRNNAIRNTASKPEMDETKYLEEVLAASKLDTGAGKIDSTAAKQIQRNNAIKNTASSPEMDEEKILQQVIARSKMDVGTEEIDENELLQQAINRSFAEEEEKNFTPMPKGTIDLLVEYAKKLSLEDTSKSQSNNEEQSSDEIDLCLICYDVTAVKQFIPCNHKCICKECAKMFNSHRCILCNKRFSALI